MEYISAQQMAERWGISKRRVQTLCTESRIMGATHIGTMWAIPANAPKPSDKRMQSTPKKATQKQARSALKKLCIDGFDDFQKNFTKPKQAKVAWIALLGAILLQRIIDPAAKRLSRTVYDAVRGEFRFVTENSIMPPMQEYPELSEKLFNHLDLYDSCMKDTLSWAYQYINKMSLDSGLEGTQFFTERYMIEYLVRRICSGQVPKGMILDPACGGGNFLSCILEKCSSSLTSAASDTERLIGQTIENLCGYELDPELAAVAAINLKLNALSILSGLRPVSVKDWDLFVPQIYTSTAEESFGFLESDFEAHSIYRVTDGMQSTLSKLVQDISAIYTNPPFQTVKGMPERQKAHLKKNFPIAKCDMCNAFLLQCITQLRDGCVFGMVTQSSWMYLDSFAELRRYILSHCRLLSIVDLGPGAFRDLNGEKANVALAEFAISSSPLCGQKVEVHSLRGKAMDQKAILLASSPTGRKIEQERLFSGDHMAYRPMPLAAQRTQMYSYERYGTPMQGTSTGDSSRLIGYYWEHLNDEEWVSVSKGGGYSRWCGLNSYVLKWGKNGEFIRETKGSALRNTGSFTRTSLVYSDTGTSGFNARLLAPAKLFVASGPGIRDIEGDPYAHLALLNSRLFSYYLRELSPKLTVAAGYIARVPVPGDLLASTELASLGYKCWEQKHSFLVLRPDGLEWSGDHFTSNVCEINEYAISLFQHDLQNELEKLHAEVKIDRHIIEAYGLDKEECRRMDDELGIPAAGLGGLPDTTDLDKRMCDMLDVNCRLNRTTVRKSALGCDGLLEYISRDTGASPDAVLEAVCSAPYDFPKCIQKYRALVIHSLLLKALGFQTDKKCSGNAALDEVGETFCAQNALLRDEWNAVSEWAEDSFNQVHAQAFHRRPYFQYGNKSFQILC